MATALQTVRPSKAESDAQDRFLRWKAKRRLSELLGADTEEQRLFASRMISGTLDPRVVDGRTEFSKRGLITRSAPLLSELLTALEGVAIGASTGEVPTAITDALSRLRGLGSRFGGFDIWIKKPKWATCDRLLEALVNHDPDAEDYLDWFLKTELQRGRSLAPYVASVLWTNSGRKWRDWDESSIYPRLSGTARTRRYWEEQGAIGLKPQANARSLDAMSLAEVKKLPQLACDPLEFLFSSEEPIKLSALRQISESLPFDDRLAGLNLTYPELQYFNLKKVYGLTQAEVGAYLKWDAATLQRVKRATDRKLREASSRGKM